MLRNGPIALFVHGMIEYVAALACFVAPFLLDYESDAATYWSIVAGVLLLVVVATTDGPTSLVSQIPIIVHVVLDYVVVAAFIASPFVLGFSDERAPTAFFIALGVAHLLVTIGTRFVSSPHPHVGSLAATTSVNANSDEPSAIDEP